MMTLTLHVHNTQAYDLVKIVPTVLVNRVDDLVNHAYDLVNRAYDLL